MVARGETGWENKMVSRSTLAGLMAGLRQIGMRGLCLDPTNEGRTRPSLEELESAR